jgi:hypothetical protein
MISAWSWFKRKRTPPQNTREQAIAMAGSRFTPFSAHIYENMPQPSPGTNSYAYTNLGLVETTPIGPAVANRQQLLPLQPQPLYANLGLKVQGIGGLVTGQIVGQPLIDPNTLSQAIGVESEAIQ